MLSLQAIEQDPQLRSIPRHLVIVAGSVSIALYKNILGIEKAERYLRIDDLDLCVSPEVYAKLYANSTPKPHAEDDEPSKILQINEDVGPLWLRNQYHGVNTLRREHSIKGLRRRVQLDVGATVLRWTHKKLLEDALPYDGYSVINPLRQLAWYENLDRKKDGIKIEMLRELIIPRFADNKVVALPIPLELIPLAQEVLGLAA
jgi:hypothetical protein